jgi:CheY-like chemotaxis protein
MRGRVAQLTFDFNREKANYKVYVANNGVEALAVIDENPELDACLLDVEMPVMDGREAMYAFAPYLFDDAQGVPYK